MGETLHACSFGRLVAVSSLGLHRAVWRPRSLTCAGFRPADLGSRDVLRRVRVDVRQVERYLIAGYPGIRELHAMGTHAVGKPQTSGDRLLELRRSRLAVVGQQALAGAVRRDELARSWVQQSQRSGREAAGIARVGKARLAVATHAARVFERGGVGRRCAGAGRRPAACRVYFRDARHAARAAATGDHENTSRHEGDDQERPPSVRADGGGEPPQTLAPLPREQWRGALNARHCGAVAAHATAWPRRDTASTITAASSTRAVIMYWKSVERLSRPMPL
jgi:hypothetical protein